MRVPHFSAICRNYRIIKGIGIIKIACTKVSAGVSTGIGDHEAKYEGSEEKDCGDEQFEIADTRSLKQMYDDIKQQGLWPVLNDYLYV